MIRSVVVLDIEQPQAVVAALFTDQSRFTAWMDDLDRCEPVSGEPGAPGSKFRLVPKKGGLVFEATVLAVEPPRMARLRLDAPRMTVLVTGTFVALSPSRTRLTSEEEFSFSGLVHRLLGFLGQAAIRKAHRHHLEAFKRFADRQ